LEALLVSTALVALAEIGDKTQLLALVLAARWRRPWPIIAGILVATLANHALAGAVGAAVTQWLGAETLRWILSLSFLAMAVWILIPDRLGAEEGGGRFDRLGPFGATAIIFFLVEMGDKTQIATVALAARYDSLLMVVLGTTLGMMAANVPAVLIGQAAATRLPLKPIRIIAALIFAALAAAVWLYP